MLKKMRFIILIAAMIFSSVVVIYGQTVDSKQKGSNWQNYFNTRDSLYYDALPWIVARNDLDWENYEDIEKAMMDSLEKVYFSSELEDNVNDDPERDIIIADRRLELFKSRCGSFEEDGNDMALFWEELFYVSNAFHFGSYGAGPQRGSRQYLTGKKIELGIIQMDEFETITGFVTYCERNISGNSFQNYDFQPKGDSLIISSVIQSTMSKGDNEYKQTKEDSLSILSITHSTMLKDGNRYLPIWTWFGFIKSPENKKVRIYYSNKYQSDADGKQKWWYSVDVIEIFEQ